MTTWVGTWRHHCPHGPIMAQFTSLGPKYSISGTTGKTTIARGGYLAHNPTKHKAPACTFERAKPPIAESCSPGPRYYVLPSITRNRKYVAPVQHICTGWRDKTSLLLLTAGSTGCFSSPRPCSSPRRTHTRSLPIALPGPGTYTLPRLVGPNTALIHTNPCCSMRGKSEHDGFAEDLSKTPGPAAFPKVELDVYKKRAPMYTMEPKSALEETKHLPASPPLLCNYQPLSISTS
uniref:Outer dense fiber of sperm tails 3 n=1 Tax=Strigops habroptila TaxID=2489341 RepID=A0A672TF63_STRHB